MEMINPKNTDVVDANYIFDTLEKTWVASFATKAITGAIVLLSSFLVPIAPLIWIMVFLVIADFLTGIFASKFPKDKSKVVEIQSTKMTRSITKLAMYGISIIAWHGIGVVFMPSVQLAYFSSAFIAFTEIKSLDENFKIMTGVSIYDELKSKIKLK